MMDSHPSSRTFRYKGRICRMMSLSIVESEQRSFHSNILPYMSRTRMPSCIAKCTSNIIHFPEIETLKILHFPEIETVKNLHFPEIRWSGFSFDCCSNESIGGIRERYVVDLCSLPSEPSIRCHNHVRYHGHSDVWKFQCEHVHSNSP